MQSNASKTALNNRSFLMPVMPLKLQNISATSTGFSPGYIIKGAEFPMPIVTSKCIRGTSSLIKSLASILQRYVLLATERAKSMSELGYEGRRFFE